MKKLTLLLLVVVLGLIACDSNAMSNDFEKDVEQVLPIIEESYDNEKEFTENEADLLDDFVSKYKHGQYLKDEDYKEMNDVEKAIFNEVSTMKVYAASISYDDTESLASEGNTNEEMYVEAEEQLEDLLKVKNDDDLPEEFKDKYPTYEIVNDMYPKGFKKDAKDVVIAFHSIMDEETYSEDDLDMPLLNDFLDKYNDDEILTSEYEIDGKHYLVNDSMKDIIENFRHLKEDLDNDYIEYETIQDFKNVDSDLELFLTE